MKCSGCGVDSVYAKGLCRNCHQQEWRLANREANARLQRKWYNKNREEVLRRRRAEWKKDALSALVDASNARARRLGKEGAILRCDVEKLFGRRYHERPAASCSYCDGFVVVGANASLDHVDSQGAHSLDNIVVACNSCNSAKQKTTATVFRERLVSSVALREDIARSNDAALAGFLVKYYGVPLADVEALVRTSAVKRA